MAVTVVTGGTGFVGSHLVRMLCERGASVRLLVRSTSRLDVLSGLTFETVIGDLRDADSLNALCADCSVLYHVAADYRLWARDSRELYESNVDGTANLLHAAQECGVRRVVYTSTVGCLGNPGNGVPGSEDTPVQLSDMAGNYKRSKFLAEQVAMDYSSRGLDVVVVNPSTPVGPADHKPSPTGQIIVDFLNGRIPAYVNTGLNLIDVRDVAIGHILAAERGRTGERYILGCQNLTLAEILAMIAKVTGRKAPTIRIPYALAYTVGAISTAIAELLTHRPPAVSLESVKMSRKTMFYMQDKAVRELGLPQSPVQDAISDAVNWYMRHGYVGRGT